MSFGKLSLILILLFLSFSNCRADDEFRLKNDDFKSLKFVLHDFSKKFGYSAVEVVLLNEGGKRIGSITFCSLKMNAQIGSQDLFVLEGIKRDFRLPPDGLVVGNVRTMDPSFRYSREDIPPLLKSFSADLRSGGRVEFHLKFDQAVTGGYHYDVDLSGSGTLIYVDEND